MIAEQLFGVLLLATNALACASHENHYNLADRKRDAEEAEPKTDWAYEASFNWGRINPSKSIVLFCLLASPIVSVPRVTDPVRF